MRKLANLFLILFLVSAGLAIANQLLLILLDLQILSGAEQLSWWACIFTGSLVYLGLGFNKHLPKTILIPLFIWLFWKLLRCWPLENIVEEHLQLYASCAQLLLGIIILKLNRRQNHRSSLLIRNQFFGPAFSGRNLFRFSLINLVVLPVALILISYSIIGNLIETKTAGFVQLKPNGLYMSERIYQQGDKQIRLAGMIHLGQKDFYTDLMASVPGTRTLILAEGVSDEEGLLRGEFGYGKIADLLGLTSQENVDFRGRLIDAIELDEPAAEALEIPDILRADIDLKQFDPHTREVLNALAKYVLNAESLANGYFEFNRWGQEHFTPDSDQIIINDLIHKRNQAVLSYLPEALLKYDTVIIPWGALHMEEIEKAVLEKGFILKNNRERLSIDFLLLPYGALWNNLTGAGHP